VIPGLRSISGIRLLHHKTELTACGTPKPLRKGSVAVASVGLPAMKMSRTVSYAVRAALQLARGDSSSPIPCSKLAASGQMPERFLLQILRILVTQGILKSTRGVEGGYALSKPAEQISLLEIMEAIDGPLEMDVGGPVEPVGPDAVGERLRGALREVTRGLRAQLEAIRLTHLLPPPEPAAVERAETP
jgi:Rrf2 family protein